MLEKYIRDLTLLYSEDLEDYRKLLNIMREYQSFLDNSDSDKDSFQKELEKFVDYRNEVFGNLQKRAEQAENIQVKIIAQTGKPLDVQSLKPHLPAAVYDGFISVLEKRRRQIEEVLENDNRILSCVKQELNGIKTELHKLQGAKKTKRVYGNSGLIEARFIDKTK